MPKLKIGPGRLSFPQLFERGSEEYGSKYGTSLLLPPDTDLVPIRHALLEAAIEKWGKDKDKWPKLKATPKTVIKDATEKDFAGYEKGWHYINLSSKDQPGVVDQHLREVLQEAEAYPGRWALCSVNAYAWANNFGKGVSLGLNNVMLLQDDDNLSGKPRAKDDFEEWAKELPEDAPGSDFAEDDDDEVPDQPDEKSDGKKHDDWGD